MNNTAKRVKSVLITGGTSGFGLELARVLLNREWVVVVMGRSIPGFQTNEHRFSFFKADFSNLAETAKVAEKICKYHSFDVIVDNAGVLSPPDFRMTGDNLEYTFQVNFLAHLLLNELIVSGCHRDIQLKIAAIVSPVYKIAGKDLVATPVKSEYKPYKAYSNSKLYLALMCSYLPAKYKNLRLNCFGFNPGVFRSGIYRNQKPWFRIMYKIAAPFMRNPAKIAGKLADLIEDNSVLSGSIYTSRKKPAPVPSMESLTAELFWKDCYKDLQKYL
jgi:NAD(P)-dependent dehydrogenase (short-subunit alcohol dehydrogenase family)